MNLSIRKYRRHRHLAGLGRTLLGAAAFVVTVLAIRSYPDLRRYVRISSM
jgi:hypothetical protein